MTIKSTGIVFSEPPEPEWNIGMLGGSKPKIVNELAPLRDKPGEWARVYGPMESRQATNKANGIRSGVPVGIERGEYEAIARTIEDGTYVWVRYMGHMSNGDSP